jgi:hypothetical protein
MWKTILATVIVVLSITTASAEALAHGTDKCYETVNQLRRDGVKGHANYQIIEHKKCWHVHHYERIEKLDKLDKHQESKKEAQEAKITKEINQAEPDEQMLRDYLLLGCAVWVPGVCPVYNEVSR